MSEENTLSIGEGRDETLGTRRLRLLIVSQQFPSHAKPTHAIYNKQQFYALSHRFDIKVLVPVDWVSWLRHGKRALSGDSPLDVHYTPYFYLPKLLRNFTPRLMSLSIGPLFRRLLGWEPDAVLASWAFPDAVAVKQILGKTDRPFFCAVHGSDVHLHCVEPSRRRQVVAAFNSANAVFTVSAELKSCLLGHGVEPERLIVNYNGVDDSKFFPIERASARNSLSLPLDREIFLFVGNLKAPKGPFDLLEAFQKLAERRRLENTTLIYIGDGEGRPQLTKMSAELESNYPGVHIMVLGSVPHEQINQWVNAANFVCLPSHSEGVPNVVLESMRCGIPVIASDVGGIPEVLDPRCGVLVPAKEVEAIVDGIEQARNHDWDPDAIREYSRKFRWGRHADLMHRLISKSLDNTIHNLEPPVMPIQDITRNQSGTNFRQDASASGVRVKASGQPGYPIQRVP